MKLVMDRPVLDAPMKLFGVCSHVALAAIDIDKPTTRFAVRLIRNADGRHGAACPKCFSAFSRGENIEMHEPKTPVYRDGVC